MDHIYVLYVHTITVVHELFGRREPHLCLDKTPNLLYGIH